ncbi:conserved hypothetical protein [Listeria monocytogenes F6900]|nr:hypothetical protein LMOG_01837 [Listeria monocytogenes J0161]EEW22511.1 conserved hypothetical protein [Listeria monocytogenes F6900]EFF99250.1 conserved hypothetical protein [Listeria monocytogenes J2818]
MKKYRINILISIFSSPFCFLFHNQFHYNRNKNFLTKLVKKFCLFIFWQLILRF